MRFSFSAIRASRLFGFGLAATLAATLTACGGGGGGDDPDVGPPAGTQQYPGGIWEGTSGAGAAQRTMLGFVDPGVDGKGGEFYFARGAAGSAGYDSLYGLLRTNVTAVQATGVTYYSVQDGKFASNLTLRGTATSHPATGRPATLSGNYTSPAGTAAATGTPTNFKLNYSALNNYPARSDLLAGTYRGAGLFGGQWVITVSPRGTLSGRVGGCSVQGSAAPRAPDSALYSVTMNLSGDEITCGAYSGSQQSGVAFLRFDDANVPNGIWMFTRNATGTSNTYVLNGLADPRQPSIPSPTPLSIAGNWAGTLRLPAGVTGDESIWGSVLPDGGFFFYTNSSFNHNALYGRLIRYHEDESFNRFVTAQDGVYFDRLLGGTGDYQGGYVGGVLVDATLESMDASGAATRLTGTYSYAGQPGGYPTGMVMQPDSKYTLPRNREPNINLIVGSYRMPGTGFGGHTTDIMVAADGSITGTTTNGCEIVGMLLGGVGSGLNLYRVEAFGYIESSLVPSNTIGCELSTGPSQSGSAAAIFDPEGRVIGLRILTAGLQVSGKRAHTVFVGDRR